MNPDKEKTKVKNLASMVNSQTESAANEAKAGTGPSKDYLSKGGILLGVAGAAAGLGTLMHSDSTAQIPSSVKINPNTPTVESVKDGMTFDEAFDHARDVDGAGAIFDWHGKSYSAWTKEEWDAMSDDDQNGFLGTVFIFNEDPEPNPETVVDPPIDPIPYIGEEPDPIDVEINQAKSEHEDILWKGNPPTEITSGGEVIQEVPEAEINEPYPGDVDDGSGGWVPEETESTPDPLWSADPSTDDQTVS